MPVIDAVCGTDVRRRSLETEPCSLDRFITREAASREQHALRSMGPLLQVPGIVWLAGGIPTGDVFPFASLKMTLKDGTEIELTPEELYDVQQYSMSECGYPPLVRYLEAHTAALHAPPSPHRLLVTCGNSNGTDIVLRCLLQRGDFVLVEEYTYAAALQAMRPLGIGFVTCPADEEGPLPQQLRLVLQERRARGQPMPKVFYAVPVSCNPTGVSWTLARKEAIYALACEFDFLFLEDDPYYYIQFPHGQPEAPMPGASNLGRSLLSMDAAGRVVRIDSFSKFLAPGLRCGWVVAPPLLHEKLVRTFQSSVQGASNLSMVTVSRMLTAWGDAGLTRHLCDMQREYCRRATALVAAIDRHLGGLATYSCPSAGMFLWVRLTGVADSATLMPALKAHKVAVVPGQWFHANGYPGPFLRMSYASASDADFETGMRRLAELLREAAAGEAALPTPPPPNAPVGFKREASACALSDDDWLPPWP